MSNQLDFGSFFTPVHEYHKSIKCATTFNCFSVQAHRVVDYLFCYPSDQTTVEPVLNGHQNLQQKLAVKGRWAHKRGMK